MLQINRQFRRVVLPAILFLGPGLAQTPETLTARSRQAGIAHLEQSRAAVVQAVTGLSGTQWKYHEAAGRWSVSEIVEHLALTETVLFGAVQDTASKGQRSTPSRQYSTLDQLILTSVPDRTTKATAAPGTEPNSGWTPDKALDEFRTRRQKTIDFLQAAKGLRDRTSESPFGEPMDAYQWLLFISAHTERHLKQINEVKNSPGFSRIK